MSDSPAQQTSIANSYYHYTGWLLGGLGGAWIVSMLLMFTDPSIWASAHTSTQSSSFGVTGSIGVFLFLCVIVPVLALDWRGFTTLHGAIKWGRMKGWQKFVVGYFFIGFSMVLLGVYFVQAIGRYRQEKARAPLLQQRHVAALEASLGIVPMTEGACRTCHKPLQVGAQFCAYCATPVVEQPKVCPACATVALPDARFCPKCRTPL